MKDGDSLFRRVIASSIFVWPESDGDSFRRRAAGYEARHMTKLRASGGPLLSPMLPHKVLLGSSTAATYAFRFGSVTAVAVASLAAGAVVARPSLGKIALFFLKIGAVLYVGGYVLLAFLEQGLVRQHAWLTQQQLRDAVAIGQFTPGAGALHLSDTSCQAWRERRW